MKTPKVIEETFLRTIKQVWIWKLEHHWKNRINDIVLCIIVPIDFKYGSGKYRRLKIFFVEALKSTPDSPAEVAAESPHTVGKQANLKEG